MKKGIGNGNGNGNYKFTIIFVEKIRNLIFLQILLQNQKLCKNLYYFVNDLIQIKTF